MPYTEFCCRSGGSNLNAGTRKGDSTEPGTSADFTYLAGTWVQSTRVFTVASGDPEAEGVVVGDYAAVDTGGATAVYVATVSAVDSTTITLSDSGFGTAPADGTHNLRIGGAWSGPAGASTFPVFNFVSNSSTGAIITNTKARINFKNTEMYSVTTAIESNDTAVTLEGYADTFGDGGKATFDGTIIGASYSIFNLTGRTILKNLMIQNNGVFGSDPAVLAATGGIVLDGCIIRNSRGSGFSSTSGGAYVIRCEAYNCNTSNTALLGGFATAEEGVFESCVSHDNAGSNGHGFVSTSAITEPLQFVNCIANLNGNSGFKVNSAWAYFKNCTSYDNGGDGISVTSATAHIQIDNCLLVGNAAYGINLTANTAYCGIVNCAFHANSTDEIANANTLLISGKVTLTSDPFVDGVNSNFQLNDTAGGGADCRGAGMGTFPAYPVTVSYPDIGAVQHEDSGGDSGSSAVIKHHAGRRTF